MSTLVLGERSTHLPLEMCSYLTNRQIVAAGHKQFLAGARRSNHDQGKVNGSSGFSFLSAAERVDGRLAQPKEIHEVIILSGQSPLMWVQCVDSLLPAQSSKEWFIHFNRPKCQMESAFYPTWDSSDDGGSCAWLLNNPQLKTFSRAILAWWTDNDDDCRSPCLPFGCLATTNHQSNGLYIFTWRDSKVYRGQFPADDFMLQPWAAARTRVDWFFFIFFFYFRRFLWPT